MCSLANLLILHIGMCNQTLIHFWRDSENKTSGLIRLRSLIKAEIPASDIKTCRLEELSTIDLSRTSYLLIREEFYQL